MRRLDVVWLAGAALVVCLDGASDVLSHGGAPVHGALVALVAAASAAVAWDLTARADLTLVAASTAAIWPLSHAAGPGLLAGALLVAAVAIARRAWFGRSPRLAAANLAGVGAGTLTWALVREPTGALLALAAAAGLAWSRPTLPTVGALGGLRAGAALLPAGALAGLFALNAVTGRLEPVVVVTGLAWGVGLFGLLWLAAGMVLGLTTVVESSARQAVGAWTAAALGTGVVVGAMVTKDPSQVLALVAVLAVPLAVLASVASARAAAVLGPGGRWTLVVPPVLALLQAGFG